VGFAEKRRVNRVLEVKWSTCSGYLSMPPIETASRPAMRSGPVVIGVVCPGSAFPPTATSRGNRMIKAGSFRALIARVLLGR